MQLRLNCLLKKNFAVCKVRNLMIKRYVNTIVHIGFDLERKIGEGGMEVPACYSYDWQNTKEH